jgi:hypothetical protein
MPRANGENAWKLTTQMYGLTNTMREVGLIIAPNCECSTMMARARWFMEGSGSPGGQQQQQKRAQWPGFLTVSPYRG